jgi:hypothetical protein
MATGKSGVFKDFAIAGAGVTKKKVIMHEIVPSVLEPESVDDSQVIKEIMLHGKDESKAIQQHTLAETLVMTDHRMNEATKKDLSVLPDVSTEALPKQKKVDPVLQEVSICDPEFIQALDSKHAHSESEEKSMSGTLDPMVSDSQMSFPTKEAASTSQDYLKTSGNDDSKESMKQFSRASENLDASASILGPTRMSSGEKLAMTPEENDARRRIVSRERSSLASEMATSAKLSDIPDRGSEKTLQETQVQESKTLNDVSASMEKTYGAPSQTQFPVISSEPSELILKTSKEARLPASQELSPASSYSKDLTSFSLSSSEAHSSIEKSNPIASEVPIDEGPSVSLEKQRLINEDSLSSLISEKQSPSSISAVSMVSSAEKDMSSQTIVLPESRPETMPLFDSEKQKVSSLGDLLSFNSNESPASETKTAWVSEEIAPERSGDMLSSIGKVMSFIGNFESREPFIPRKKKKLSDSKETTVVETETKSRAVTLKALSPLSSETRKSQPVLEASLTEQFSGEPIEISSSSPSKIPEYKTEPKNFDPKLHLDSKSSSKELKEVFPEQSHTVSDSKSAVTPTEIVDSSSVRIRSFAQILLPERTDNLLKGGTQLTAATSVSSVPPQSPEIMPSTSTESKENVARKSKIIQSVDFLTSMIGTGRKLGREEQIRLQEVSRIELIEYFNSYKARNQAKLSSIDNLWANELVHSAPAISEHAKSVAR